MVELLSKLNRQLFKLLTEKTFLVFSTWGDSGAGEGNRTLV